MKLTQLALVVALSAGTAFGVLHFAPGVVPALASNAPADRTIDPSIPKATQDTASETLLNAQFNQNAPATAKAAPSGPLGHSAATLPSFADIVEQNAPSVVLVRIEKKRGAEDEEEDPIAEFFRRFGEGNGRGGRGAPPKGAEPPAPGSGRGQDRTPSLSGLGSGFFIDANGLLLTNAHVVKGAERIIVRTSDKKEYKAKVVGLDERTDVALVQIIDKGTFRPVVLGSVDAMRVGDWVLAIGSPFGFEASATVGVLSAKGRSLPDENFIPFLQSDAAVNPGNSGGPLFNATGEVIGINTQIYSRSGGYMGLSFSLPIDHAMRIASKIKRDGRVRHGRVGAVIQELTPDLAKALNLEGRSGAAIVNVEPASPADKAGLRSGDVILTVGGKPLTSGSSEFVRNVAETDPGDKIVVGILRAGKKMDITVVVGEAKSDAPATPKETEPAAPAADPDGSVLGMKLKNLGKAEQSQLGVGGGFIVLDAGALGKEMGVVDGDAILMVNGSPVESIRAFEKLVADTPKGAPIALLVLRGKDRRFVVLKKPD